MDDFEYIAFAKILALCLGSILIFTTLMLGIAIIAEHIAPRTMCTTR